MKDDKKYVFWGLLGIGVAGFFYFMSQKNAASGTTNGGTVQTPVLVEQPSNSTGASPTANESLSTQPNIIGESSNSAIPNGTNPYGVSANYTETPGTWNGQLNVSQPSSPTNNVNWGAFSGTPAYTNQNG